MIAAPPITESGIAAIIPPSFGNNPNNINYLGFIFAKFSAKNIELAEIRILSPVFPFIFSLIIIGLLMFVLEDLLISLSGLK